MQNDKVKICFIAPKAYPLFDPQVKGVFGGAEVDLYNIAVELAKDNRFSVRIIVADYGQPNSEKIDNVEIIKSLSFKSNPLSQLIAVWHALKTADAQYYMIKTASPGVPVTAYFCKKHNRNFIYRIAHIRECDGSYIKKKFVLGPLFRSALRSARQVFCQNQYDIEMLKNSIGIDAVHIPNGHRSAASEADIKNKILWVGRSSNDKQPGLFLELARNNPQYKFTIICQKATGDKCFDKVKNSAKEIPNLEFIERVPFHEIDNYFHQAKVFVNTSISEGFPNTFIQACKTATPILSLNVNPDNFLDRYQCGKCADGDVRLMNKYLSEIIDGNYNDYSKNALNCFVNNNDISKIIEQYKTFFLSHSDK